jgi:hypothetical protein
MDKDKDHFNEIIRDKLENYTFPVDEDSWDKIAERLNPPPRKTVQLRWIATIAVAASIALFLILFPVHKKTYYHESADQLSDNEKTIIQDVPEKEIVQPVIQQVVEHSTVSKKLQSNERFAENNLTTEVISVEKTVGENPTIQTTEEPRTPEKQQVSPFNNFDFDEEEQIPVIKYKKRQSLRFSIGSGGNLLAQNSTDMFKKSNSGSEIAYFRSSIQEATKPKIKDILSAEEYPEVVHNLPLSFGVTVKKELSRSVAIESGIVYTFISTKFNRDDYPRSKADLNLHYIGIPLNIHTSLYKARLSQWEVYLSTGGMVEKGILAQLKQKTYYDDIANEMKTVASNEKINGLQWSVGISPGIDYKIHKNYSVYFEPKLSYYFDNDQPVSARTEHPVVVSINAGVRYVW